MEETDYSLLQKIDQTDSHVFFTWLGMYLEVNKSGSLLDAFQEFNNTMEMLRSMETTKQEKT